jgi:translation elongation factor P/translation initiation factor 5A
VGQEVVVHRKVAQKCFFSGKRLLPSPDFRLFSLGSRLEKLQRKALFFMATANDLRRGMAINYNGDISVVLDMQHRTPGNLRAFVQATLRSIRTGKSSDVRFSSTEKIDPVPMITTKMEFSYKDGTDYVFTDPENYEPSPWRRNWWATPKITWWKTAWSPSRSSKKRP